MARDARRPAASARDADTRPGASRDVRRAGDTRPGATRAERRGDDARPAAGAREARRGAERRPEKSTQRREATEERAVDPEKLVARQPWANLRPLLESAGCDVESALASLRVYATELLAWNRGVSNLISRHDETRLVDRHLAESLQPASLLRASGCRQFVDLGSGSGLPGLPLAIVGVGEAWTLVESRRNKTLFMRKVCEVLKLKNVRVKCSRLETLIEEAPQELSCDGFTSRATMTIEPTLAMAAAIVRPGGRAFLWKGSGYVDEMANTKAEWSRDWEFEQGTPIFAGPNVVAIFIRK